MNTRKGKAKFTKFIIILDSECSSTSLTGRLVEKLHPDKNDVMKWHMQAVNVTTSLKVYIDLILPAISVIMM